MEETRRREFFRLPLPFCGKEVDEQQEGSSQYARLSLSNNVLLPTTVGAEGAACHGKQKSSTKFIISPHQYKYKLWMRFLVLLVLYTAWVSPFEFGFLKKPPGVLPIVDNIINAFFAVDIILTFFVAYFDKHKYDYVTTRKKIAWQYATTWFVLDVISTIPTELAQKMLPSGLQVYGLFSMLRLWRLRRVSAMFARCEKDINFNYNWVRYVKLICVTLFAVHVEGCLNYKIAANYHDPSKTWIGGSMPNFHEKSVWVRYVTSMYMTITTVTTVGYGDYHPVNSREMIFAILCMLFNLGLVTYLIGNMTTLVVHGTNRTRDFRDKIQAATDFAQRNRLPDNLGEQMISHLRLKYRTEGLQQQDTLDSLPKAIKSSISNFLFFPILEKTYLFKGVSKDLLFQLVSEMKPEYFPPKEDVILQNEAPTDIYIIATGAVCLFNSSDRSGIVRVVRETDICGEIGVLCYKPQPYSVCTKGLSLLLRLNRTSFLNIVQSHAGDGIIIMNNLLQRLKESTEPKLEEYLTEIENMLACDCCGRRKMSNFPNSIFGMMSTAKASDGQGLLSSSMKSFTSRPVNLANYSARVTLICPEKESVTGKLVHLPESLQELIELGSRKFGISASKVLTKDRAEIEDIELIRDGDQLLLVNDKEKL